ncbi:hypothetical protein BASA50_005762 [Batrachochytrium salamandrivorans]|uniref:Uncharacterized protein n=1 Tax=Batrachochytrium salamandrivorans TaxID=1357716 RepID=A0ABQ8FBX0_9FUNG|nr:hypothetical protein BASA50_005762 [Batrachochytrium salamandrivorans]
MKIAAIFVTSLLAIACRAAPVSALDDNDPQLYKRQPLPPSPPPPEAPSLPESSLISKSYDWWERLKTKKSNKPAGGGGSSKAPQSNARLHLGQIPESGVRLNLVNREKKLWEPEPNSEEGVINNNDDPDFNPKPKPSSKTPGKVMIPDFDQQARIIYTGVKDTSPPEAPPLPSKNEGPTPFSWRKTDDNDPSKDLNRAISTSKISPRIGFKLPEFNPGEVSLKHVVQKPKPDYPPEPLLFQAQLRKTLYRDSSKGMDSANNGHTSQEKNTYTPFTSYQQKSSYTKSPPAVPSRPNVKLIQEARMRAGF